MKLLFILLLFCSFTIQSQNLIVISYNLRYDNPNDGDNKWEFRKEFLSQQIQFYSPDIFGTQEGKLHQLEYLEAALNAYSYIGRGRDNSENQGEFSAIFYKKEKFNVLEQATFWLSENPNEVSKGWDANLERICTYALFENIKTKQKFYFFNTHFDHVGEKARVNSASLIVEKINSINKQNYPVIFTGDLNSEQASRAYSYLLNHLNDSRLICKSPPFGPEGTFNNFEFHKPVTTLIDYVFTSKKNIEVSKYAVLSDSKNCKYPSDHLPVYVELTFRID